MISRILPLIASVTTRLPQGMRQAYGDLSNRVIEASSLHRDLRMTVAEMGSALVDFSTPPTTPSEQRLYEFASLIRPFSSESCSLRRIGGEGDGAYAMMAIDGADAAISIGVGHDVSWDQAVTTSGVPVYPFDPTVSELPGDVPGGRFFQVGLGKANMAVPRELQGLEVRPLAELLRMCGMENSSEMILKVDVEGAEWDALHDVDFQPFQQVLMEMHDLRRLQDDDAADAVLQTIRGLASTHYPIHVHANNERPFNRFDRYWFPDVIELSYVRKDRLAQPRPVDAIETLVDRATNPAYPDYNVSGLLTVVPSTLFS